MSAAPPPPIPRVGLELTALEVDVTGSARYVRALRGALEQLGGVELVPISQPRRGRLSARRLPRGLARELAWFPVGLPRRARRLGLDVLHCPSSLAPVRPGLPLVVTVQDVIPWERPEWLTRANVLQQRVVLRAVLRAAARVIVPSAHTGRRLAELAGVDPGRIDLIPHGIDERFTPGPAPEELLSRLDVAGPYVLCVGTLQPRKNLEAALEAFERLSAAGARHLLVIAGARGWHDRELAERIERSPAAARIRLPGRVSDGELVGLYRAAECLLFPSRYEGFGFPPLEAMACGTPVVAADRTSLPEVVGDAGLLADPDDVGAIERALGELLGSEELRSALRERGLARASGFTWRRTGELTLETYARALAAAG